VRVTPQSHPDLVGHTTVTVDGVDITMRCNMADDERGEARVFCGDTDNHCDWRRDGPAHLLPDADDEACQIVIRGKVVIRRRGHFGRRDA
jgi:hypothetical protein